MTPLPVYYWLRIDDEWKPAELFMFDGEVTWIVTGFQKPFRKDDPRIRKIGPKMTSPDEEKVAA